MFFTDLVEDMETGSPSNIGKIGSVRLNICIFNAIYFWVNNFKDMVALIVTLLCILLQAMATQGGRIILELP